MDWIKQPVGGSDISIQCNPPPCNDHTVCWAKSCSSYGCPGLMCIIFIG